MEIENKEIEKQRQNLLLFVWEKRKVLGIISSIAFVLSFIVAMLIKPLFLSTAIVFPAATNTVTFSEQRNAKAASMDFGEEEQAEQLVQILNSSRVRNLVVEKFDLMKHYEISSTDVNKNYKLLQEYNGHITSARTKYGSIQIDVLDVDPVLAAEIANTIVDLIDTVKNKMISERTIPAFEINLRKKELLQKELQLTLHTMDTLADKGVVSLVARTELFTAFVDAKSREDRDFLKKQIDVNLKYGAKFDGLERIRNEKIINYEVFLNSYEQAESDANSDFTHKFIVEKAVVADKKSKPKRLIIIFLATMGTFVFSIFLLLIMDRVKELKQQA